MEWIFVFIIALLQLVDIFTTQAVIKDGGRELWGPQRWLQKRLGLLPALIFSKAILVGFAVWVATLVPAYHTLLVLLYFITMIFAVVCFSNLSVWGTTRSSGRS